MRSSLRLSVARRLAHALVSTMLLAGVAGCASTLAEEDESADETALSTLPPRAVSYDGEHLLDVYEPAAGPKQDRPLVVWIHGGAFANNSRRDPHLVQLAQHSASLGYVSISIDYTLANVGFDEAHPFPYPVQAIDKAVADARAAIHFMRAHAAEYGIDPQRVAVGGASAGAITALHVAYATSAANRDEGIRAVVDLWGALETAKQVEPGDAPLIVFHGTADLHWMPFPQAIRLRDSARAAGVSCTFHPLPGKNHGPWEDLDTYLAEMTPFLRKNLAR